VGDVIKPAKARKQPDDTLEAQRILREAALASAWQTGQNMQTSNVFDPRATYTVNTNAGSLSYTAANFRK